MKKSSRWAWVVALLAAAGIALVLLFVLSLTGDAGRFVERHIAWLYWINLAVAALLALVVLLAALRLAIRRRQGKFGTTLLIKLAGIFALVGVLPGVLIYTVSYQFVSRSIEVWFDARVAPWTRWCPISAPRPAWRRSGWARPVARPRRWRSNACASNWRRARCPWWVRTDRSSPPPVAVAPPLRRSGPARPCCDRRAASAW
jgi:hypothetical protein